MAAIAPMTGSAYLLIQRSWIRLIGSGANASKADRGNVEEVATARTGPFLFLGPDHRRALIGIVDIFGRRHSRETLCV